MVLNDISISCFYKNIKKFKKMSLLTKLKMKLQKQTELMSSEMLDYFVVTLPKTMVAGILHISKGKASQKSVIFVLLKRKNIAIFFS